MSHDRTGEQIDAEDDEDAPAPKPHDPRCKKGWLDRDAAVPCLVCKPHLDPDVRRRRMGLGEKK